MGAQRLGTKKTRQLARQTGLDIVRAWTHGVHKTFLFVTRDHQHGWVDTNDLDCWGFFVNDGSRCYDTCKNLDPSSPTGYKEE